MLIYGSGMERRRRSPPLALVALALTPVLAPALACSAASPAGAPESAGLSRGDYSLRVTDGTLVLAAKGEARVTIPRDALELGLVAEVSDSASYDPYWLEYGGAQGAPAPEPPSELTWERPTACQIASQAESALDLTCDYPHASARLALRAEADGRFAATLTPSDTQGHHVVYVRVGLRVGAREGFYGLGEWPDSVEHRGKLRPMQIEIDGELESQNNEAHVPIPLLIGTSGWGAFVESKRVGLFDVARKRPDAVEITYALANTKGAPDPWKLHLFGAKAALDITKLYYDVTGYPRVPAPWGFGPVMWRNENRDQAQLEDDIAQLRTRDLAATGLWIDRPYATAVNTFDFDAAKFQDPRRMIRAAHDAGLRVALWHTPYLEPKAQPLRAEAERSGYFVPTAGIPLNSWSIPVDFTRPDAVTFWQRNLRRYTELGVEGFKLDFAEDVVPSLRDRRLVWGFADGSDERTMHHDYTRLYHRVYQETLPQEGSFMICRAGRYGDQVNVSVIWPGDMDASFTKHRERFVTKSGKEVTGVGGLPATLIQGLGLGPSGFPFFGADTGGYRDGPPDKELYIRWFEQTALSSVMQVGDSSSQMPWEFLASNGRDQATLDLYRSYARLHLRLFPYLYTHARAIARDGRPIMRPLGLAYPALGAHPNDAYLLGDALLAAPVVERGQSARSVPFPQGDWADFWDGSVRTGDGTAATVSAPLERAPLFLRRGGIVPMLRPTIDTLSPVADPTQVDSLATDNGSLWIRAFVDPASASRFDVFGGATITITPEADAGGTAFALSAEGWSAAPSVFELYGVAAVARVEQRGQPLPKLADAASVTSAQSGYAWDGRVLVVKGTGALRVVP